MAWTVRSGNAVASRLASAAAVPAWDGHFFPSAPGGTSIITAACAMPGPGWPVSRRARAKK
jgi:hypothetical protein